MHYFFEDLTGLAAATPLALLLLVMPGFGIAALLERAGLIRGGVRDCWGLVLGLAILPAADALLLRWLGFGAMLVLHVGLALAGARTALRSAQRVPPRWWLAVAFCWAVAAWGNIDFDWNGRLYQPVTLNDGVKHAAVVGALVRYGVPLHDPFFFRPGISGYYYYFYLGPALIHWLGAGVIDSRAAFAAGTFVTLLALPALLMLLADAAELIPGGARRRFVRITLLLCCASGLDLVPGLFIGIRTGTFYAQLDWWSEEVRWAITSILWVPHHIAAVIAVYAGCLLLSGTERARPMLRAAVAGLAFATAFGCSIWIAIAAVPILGLWWLYERVKSGMSGMWALPLSAVAALLLCIPQIIDIREGRTTSGFPLGFYLRPIGPVRVLPHGLREWIVHLAVLPGGYMIEFGIFALGAIVFLTRRSFAESRSTPIGRLLLVGAPVALIMVTFVRSVVIYNDFGWRSIWFAQIPALLWTASILSAEPRRLRTPIWAAAMTLGLAATLYDLTGLRLIRPFFYATYVNAHPDVDFDMRGAYGWIDRTLPRDLIVQHNPMQAYRALDFGLYSDRPVGVADREARLFGADAEAVQNRIALIEPIFERRMPLSELRQRSAGAGVGALLINSADPLWRAGGGPPRDWTCAYRSAHSCVMLLGKPQ